MSAAIRSLAVVLAVAGPAFAESAATHRQVREIAVKGKSGMTLQTLCPRPDGGVYALLGASRYGDAGTKTAEVRALDAAGQEVNRWAVDFKGQSINTGPDGAVYVAGDGFVAKFDAAGKQLAKLELPHVAELVKDTAKLQAEAKQQIAEEKEMYAEQIKTFESQIDELKKKKEQSAADKAQMRQLMATLNAYKSMQANSQKQKPEAVAKNIAGRLRVINSITATPRDVFIVCGESKGYGYAVWRMTPEFTGAKKIIGNLGGCCGQMDVQAVGDELYVAENTKHKVGRYDRDGKKIATFGERGKDAAGANCFGGCCNPMNTRVAADGLVYTAESEGHVKAYKPTGEFVGAVGTAKLKGGCKNVALAVSGDGDTVYFCDQPGQRVLILARSKSAQ